MKLHRRGRDEYRAKPHCCRRILQVCVCVCVYVCNSPVWVADYDQYNNCNTG